ncbi:hypothetical protein CI610_00324 [invertebrate metagenome]|uniref:Uncharacterized protein n=1 Tax=invertebrate metagenome TaxID=1711999 RepID=A0A2H9TBT5_9ZZZZ
MKPPYNDLPVMDKTEQRRKIRQDTQRWLAEGNTVTELPGLPPQRRLSDYSEGNLLLFIHNLTPGL